MRRSRHWLWGIFTAAAACAAPPAQASADPVRFILTYSIHYAGLSAGAVTVTGEMDGATYEIAAQTRTLGLVDAFVGFRSSAASAGLITASGLTPTRHEVDNVWRGKDRSVRIAYRPGGAVDAVAVPDAAADDREPVAIEDQAGTVDPITAGLGLTLAAGDAAPCRRRIDVFDGRRLYAFVPEAPAEERYEVAGGGVQCSFGYLRLGGRSDDPWLPRAETPTKGKFWFERIDARLPPIAVRVTARAGIADVVIRLESYSVSEASGETAAIGPPGTSQAR